MNEPPSKPVHQTSTNTRVMDEARWTGYKRKGSRHIPAQRVGPRRQPPLSEIHRTRGAAICIPPLARAAVELLLRLPYRWEIGEVAR